MKTITFGSGPVCGEWNRMFEEAAAKRKAEAAKEAADAAYHDFLCTATAMDVPNAAPVFRISPEDWRGEQVGPEYDPRYCEAYYAVTGQLRGLLCGCQNCRAIRAWTPPSMPHLTAEETIVFEKTMLRPGQIVPALAIGQKMVNSVEIGVPDLRKCPATGHYCPCPDTCGWLENQGVGPCA